MKSILKNFPITNEEYLQLESKFDDLCKYAAWQLIRNNRKNNLTDDWQDVAQELRMAIIRAGSYYKRQCYIEKSLKLVKRYARNRFVKRVVKELEALWGNRTKHGAGRQKFGEHQEFILNSLVKTLVPAKQRPNSADPLVMDNKFLNFGKIVMWNQKKFLGRCISKSRSVRFGMVSLGEHTNLC